MAKQYIEGSLQIQYLILCFQSTDESPTLLELQRFPVKGRFEDIVAEIQNDYKHFGIQLLEDSKGVKIKGIETSKLGDPVRITVEILSRWLLGKGRTPVTWRTFVECLRESGLNVPANYIEATLDRSTFLRPPDSHIPVSANSSKWVIFQFECTAVTVVSVSGSVWLWIPATDSVSVIYRQLSI